MKGYAICDSFVINNMYGKIRYNAEGSGLEIQDYQDKKKKTSIDDM